MLVHDNISFVSEEFNDDLYEARVLFMHPPPWNLVAHQLVLIVYKVLERIILVKRE